MSAKSQPLPSIRRIPAEEVLAGNYDALPLAVLGFGLPDQKLSIWNGAAEDLFGLSAEKALGQNFFALGLMPGTIPPPERFSHWLEQQLSAGYMLFQNQVEWPFYGRVRATLGQDAQGNLRSCLLCVEECSEERRQQLDLQWRENRLRILLDSNLNGIFILGQGLRILFASPAVAPLVGLPPQELLGKSLHSFLLESDLLALEERVEQVLAQPKKSLRLNLRLKLPEGGMRWIQATLSNEMHTPGIDGLVFNFQDIDREEAVVQALKWSNERFRLATRATKDVIWEWKVGTDELTWGENFDQVLGHLPEQNERSLANWAARVHPEEREQTLNSLLKMADSDQSKWETRYRFKLSNGAYAYIIDRGYVVRDEQGRASRMVGAMQDVSEAHWAQDKLRRSEEKFRKLFEYSFIGVALVDLSSGRWLDCNQALLNMLGYSRAEMLQMTYADITPEAFRESDRLQNDTLSNKRTYGPYQKAFIRKDRQEISVILAGFLVELEDGRRGGWNHILDISQIEKTNLALEQAETRFRNYVENASDTFIILGSEGKIEYLSPNIQELLGYSAKQLMAKDHLDFMHPEDKEYVDGVFAGALENPGQARRSTFRAGHQKGHWVWVEVNGRFQADEAGTMRAYLVMRKMDSEAQILQEKLRKLSWVAAQTTNSVLITDAQERIEWVNQSFERLSGYRLAEVQGKKPSEVLHRDKATHFYESITRKLLDQRKPFRAEVLNYHKEGHPYWIETFVTPIFDQRGELSNFIAIENDINERKRQAEELEQNLALSRKQNEQLQNFTYILSHNFRSHGTNILGLVGELKLENDAKRRKELFRLLEQSSEDLLEALDNLHEVLRIRENKEAVREDLPVQKYLRKSLQVLQQEIQRCEAQVFDGLPADYTLPFHPAYLESVLYNLLSNALRYRQPDRPLELRIEPLQKEGFKGLAVIDNGRGIDLERHREQLFGMYQTFHRHPESKGLGLFLIKNQVEAQGGEIEVDSKPGEGSTFKVWLPD